MILVIMINFDDKFANGSMPRVVVFSCRVAEIFFPGLFFYVYIESPNPKKNPENPTPQSPNPINWKAQPQKPNLREKSQKNNSGKKYIVVLTDNGQ